MENKKIAISAENITKIYKLYDKPSDRMKEALIPGRKRRHKEHYALRGINMNIYQGETVGIIGTNGSGKSTILKIITGVLNPTGGSITVDGRISALLELGAGFNMEYNGIENIYLNGTMMGFSEKEIDARMQDILEFADIGDYVYQPCKTYSSGMFVRLAFAVAINIDPEILIVDEALSVGDVFFQAKCYHKFDEFKKRGKTILFVSHDLGSIAKYCDRVILLNKGVKLGEGGPKEMIDTYKQVLVGQYELPSEEEGVNEKALEYGTKEAEIVGFYMTDEKGVRTTAILKGGSFTLHMRVRFHNSLPAPIFAFTIKDKQGTELTGTNSMVEKAFLGSVRAGEEKQITFTQRVDLQGGEYLVSLGVTGYEGDVFQVYHRLYDVLNLTVVSDKNTVGVYDMNSVVRVETIETIEEQLSHG
ncbi:MAG: ABC transporter ATP-binding protein [Lachnospiraceae bacterium]|nr:ABC transporter ATP-binding protein [Lachnospiraceae bacterium]